MTADKRKWSIGCRQICFLWNAKILLLFQGHCWDHNLSPKVCFLHRKRGEQSKSIDIRYYCFEESSEVGVQLWPRQSFGKRVQELFWESRPVIIASWRRSRGHCIERNRVEYLFTAGKSQWQLLLCLLMSCVTVDRERKHEQCGCTIVRSIWSNTVFLL